jgi:hypothetical protein
MNNPDPRASCACPTPSSRRSWRALPRKAPSARSPMSGSMATRQRSISAICDRLLDCVRLVRRTADADRRPRRHHRVMLALLAGVAIKLKVFGNGP